MITVASQTQYIEEIKRSIFTATVQHVDSVDDAMEFIKNVSVASATHNCWAYIIDKQYRFSDDGEPASTAGKPIYSTIEHSGLENIVIVVTRESSGIKLGTGGLIRAYGGVSSKVLDRAEKLEIKERVEVQFKVSFDFIGKVYHIIDDNEAIKESEQFDETGVNFLISVDKEKEATFKRELVNSSKGSAQIETEKEK